MGRSTGYRHSAVANPSVFKTVASFRKEVFFYLACTVFLWCLFLPWNDCPLTVPFVGVVAQPSGVASFVTPSSAVSALKDKGIAPHTQSSDSVATEGQGGYTFHPISYADCSVPLVVGGEIVRCEKETETSNSASYALEGSREPLGPLLNQLVAVEIQDFLYRSTTWRQRAQRTLESSLAAGTVEEKAANGKAEGSSNQDTRNAGHNVSENPVFIRIFGRWTPFVGDLHLWLDADANHDPLRRLAEEATSFSHPKRLTESSSLQGHGATTPERGVAASDKPKGRYPFLYWRESSFSLSVQNSCIALIKLPAKEKGPVSLSANSVTAFIPESCGEAQRLLSSQEISSEPFWLSCGPQLELSKLTHFITFSFSQEKINQVLAALEYSVEIWREPHGGAAHMNPTLPDHEFKRPIQKYSRDQVGNEDPQKYDETGSSGRQPGASPARDVEGRRLAAEREEPLPEPPKWRVGICLLRGPHRRTKDPNTEERKTRTELRDGVEKAVKRGWSRIGERGREEQPTRPGNVEQTSEAIQPKDTQAPVEDSDAQLVGEIRFHVRPEITPHPEDDNKREDPETIQIRHFIDAGWMYTREVRGVNLTRFNRLALKESREGASRPCVGFWEEHSLLSVAPESYAWDEMTEEETLRFVFSSSLKGPVESREALYNSVPGRHATSRMHICFYSNDEQPFGLLLGEVQFVIDSADATLLVFFILFVFLAIPVMCAVAISFHVYKHRHLRERLQRLVLVQQRDAVEQLLMRELGLTREDPEDANDDDDEEEPHAEGTQGSFE